MLVLFAALALSPAPPSDLTAVGVVVGSRPAAILRSGTHSRVVSVGDSVFGGRVVGISSAGVTLEFGGTRTQLSLSKGLPAAPAPPTVADESPRPAQTMERREVERRLGQEMPRILAETAVVSLAEQGLGTGVSLTRVAEGTLLTDVGLRVGDVLVSVNGVPVDSLATLIGLWPRFQNESQVTAVVLRGGQPTSLTVSLK